MLTPHQLQIVKKAACGVFGTHYDPKTPNHKAMWKWVKWRDESFLRNIKIEVLRHNQHSPFIKKRHMPDIQNRVNDYYRDKEIYRKMNVLVKANNTYQTPKK